MGGDRGEIGVQARPAGPEQPRQPNVVGLDGLPQHLNLGQPLKVGRQVIRLPLSFEGRRHPLSHLAGGENAAEHPPRLSRVPLELDFRDRHLHGYRPPSAPEGRFDFLDFSRLVRMRCHRGLYGVGVRAGRLGGLTDDGIQQGVG